MREVSYYVDRLQLQPHPEGGYFSETYRAGERIAQPHLPARFPGDRAFSTAIYFLLEAGQFSAFHRIRSDEVWHFYAGQPLHIYVIPPDGSLEIIRLGDDLEDSVFQAVVRAGCWFASQPASATGFSLVGCTVAPGFDFEDFEMASYAGISQLFPQHDAVIRALCRDCPPPHPPSLFIQLSPFPDR